jgi:hypothetical protein
MHTVATTWRPARVAELEATAAAVEELLEHLADVEAALAGDEKIGTASRALAALLRSACDELRHEARRLDAEVVEL